MTDYTRQPHHWRKDLADRSFEGQVRALFDGLGWEYEDNTAQMHLPDFFATLTVSGEPQQVALEVKEKRQRYRRRWVELANGVPQAELLVQDEVSSRKLLTFSPFAFLLFRDRVSDSAPYVLFSALDLFCMPKVRVARPIHRNSPRLKGKWLLDKRHGRAFDSLQGSLQFLAAYVAEGLMDDLRRVEPYGEFVGEAVLKL